MPQEVLENIPRDRFERLMLPRDWANVMFYPRIPEHKEMMTIGIPGRVALLNVTIPNVSLDEAAKYMTMNAKLRLETTASGPKRHSSVSKQTYAPMPDSSVRTKDLMNAYQRG